MFFVIHTSVTLEGSSVTPVIHSGLDTGVQVCPEKDSSTVKGKGSGIRTLGLKSCSPLTPCVALGRSLCVLALVPLFFQRRVIAAAVGWLGGAGDSARDSTQFPSPEGAQSVLTVVGAGVGACGEKEREGPDTSVCIPTLTKYSLPSVRLYFQFFRFFAQDTDPPPIHL